MKFHKEKKPTSWKSFEFFESAFGIFIILVFISISLTLIVVRPFRYTFLFNFIAISIVIIIDAILLYVGWLIWPKRIIINIDENSISFTNRKALNPFSRCRTYSFKEKISIEYWNEINLLIFYSPQWPKSTFTIEFLDKEEKKKLLSFLKSKKNIQFKENESGEIESNDRHFRYGQLPPL